MNSRQNNYRTRRQDEMQNISSEMTGVQQEYSSTVQYSFKAVDMDSRHSKSPSIIPVCDV